MANTKHCAPFSQIENGVLYSSSLSVYQKMVYCVLVSYADNVTRVCYPSYATIADRVGCSRRTVIKAIAFLSDHDYIRKAPQFNQKNEFHSNLYTILPLPKSCEATLGRQADELQADELQVHESNVSLEERLITTHTADDNDVLSCDVLVNPALKRTDLPCDLISPPSEDVTLSSEQNLQPSEIVTSKLDSSTCDILNNSYLNLSSIPPVPCDWGVTCENEGVSEGFKINHNNISSVNTVSVDALASCDNVNAGFGGDETMASTTDFDDVSGFTQADFKGDRSDTHSVLRSLTNRFKSQIEYDFLVSCFIDKLPITDIIVSTLVSHASSPQYAYYISLVNSDTVISFFNHIAKMNFSSVVHLDRYLKKVFLQYIINFTVTLSSL